MNPPDVPYRTGDLLFLARSAELVVPIREANPELIPQVRSFVTRPDNALEALTFFDADRGGVWSYREILSQAPAPLADLLGFGPYDVAVDALPAIGPDDLGHDPGYLFSPEVLKALCAFYCPDDHGIVNALHAKINAGQLQAFRNQVQAQAGKKISPQGARVLSVLSMTL